MKINKVTLAERVASRTGLSRQQAEAAIEAVAEAIIDAVKAGETATITGFGQFSSQQRQARNGVNPRTSERIVIPPVVIPKFVAGKNFKEALRVSETPTAPAVQSTPEEPSPSVEPPSSPIVQN